MGKLVKIELEVTEEAAQALENDERRQSMARLVSRLAERRAEVVDPLVVLMERIGRRARAEGLTDEEVDAELAAYNAERRTGREHDR